MTRRWRTATLLAAALVPLAFLLIFFVWPVAAMLAKGIGAGEALTRVLASARTWNVLWHTVWMAGAGTALSVLLGVPGAYVLYRLRFPGRRAVRALSVVPFVLPTVVVGVAFRALLGDAGPYGFLGIDKTSWAVVLAMAFFNYAVVTRTVGSLWDGLPLHDDAARTLGASPARAFFTVTLPELAPAIASSAAIVFLFCSTAYALVRTLGTPGFGTLETEIYTQTNTFLDLEAAAIYSALQLLVVLCAVAAAGYFRSRAPLAIARRPLRRPTRGAIPALVVTGATAVFLIAAPIASLAINSLRRGGQWTLDNYRELARSTAGGTTALDALGNSLWAAALATVVSVGAGVILAVVLSRRVFSRPGKLAQAGLEGLSLMPLGISAVTLGFGTFITLRLTLENTQILVPAVQAVVALPLVTRAMLPVLRSINPRLREASATLGAGPWRTLLNVDGRMALRSLGVAIGFGFAVALGEFGATSFLAAGQNQTLPLLIERLINRPGAGNYGMAMAASTVLGVVTGGIMALCDSLGGATPGVALATRPSHARSAPRANAERSAPLASATAKERQSDDRAS